MTRLRDRSHRWRWVLAAWTLVVWATRLRNVIGDDDLDGGEFVIALVIALGFVMLGAALLGTLFGIESGQRPVVMVLVIAGILRWTIRTPFVLASDEWSAGFKVVHTVLWIVTVVISVLAWRESDASNRKFPKRSRSMGNS